MKPSNLNTSNCESTSSNCVIYDGPDLSCIKICNGASITDVEFALATQLCSIMDQLNISNYDLQCLGVPGVTLPDFPAFINLLINKVCTTQGGTQSISTNSDDCPKCVVDLAPVFQYPNPSNGDLVTKDLVQNYVQKIGLTVGGIVNQVATIQQFNSQISGRVQDLENTPVPTLNLPEIYPVGIADPNVPLPLDKFVALLEPEFVTFRQSVGTTTEIYDTITTPPSDFNTAKALGVTGGVLGTLSGWNEDPKTLSETIQNLWLTVLDARSGLRNLQLTFNSACDGISIEFVGTLENKILKLYFSGVIPNNFSNCHGVGTLLKIEDGSGNYFNATVDIKSNLSNLSGVTIDLNSTTINFADDLKVSGLYCLTDINTGTTCQNYLETVVNNNVNCPTLSVSPQQNSVNYQFTHVSGILTYSIQIFDNTNILVQSTNRSVSGPESISGSFSSLVSNSSYKIRLQIITMNNTKTCPFVPFMTSANPCGAPNLISAIVNT